jgi:hypothetical protein
MSLARNFVVSLVGGSLVVGVAVVASAIEALAAPVPSLTSETNFINFCATAPGAVTNLTQVVTGSCNPSPAGQ